MSKDFFLAVNTSLPQAEILLFKDPGTFFSSKWNKERSHSEVITEEFLKLQKKAGIDLEAIAKVYCVVGPGSFTGVRVGVSFCKTLAYSLDIPLVAINSLDLLSLSCQDSSRAIVSLIDAQKNSLFYSCYQDKNGAREITKNSLLVKVDELDPIFSQPVHICGQGIDRYRKWIDASVLKNMIQKEDWKNGHLVHWFTKNTLNIQEKELAWHEIQPLYIKASAPEEKLKEQSSD